MKLSPPQRRALSKLATIESDRFGAWTTSGLYGMRSNTLDSLVRLGLAERRTGPSFRQLTAFRDQYRVTPRGYGLALVLGEKSLLTPDV